MVFPVVMYGCESWTIKKAECRRIDGFELWCWRRLLRVPWTVRRSNQSILKEISPGCSSEGLMLKLKLQYFGHLMQSWLFGKDPDAGKDWGHEEKGTTEDEMVGWYHQLNGHGFGWTLGDEQGGLVCCGSWGHKESDMTEWLNWTDYAMEQGLRFCISNKLQSDVNEAGISHVLRSKCLSKMTMLCLKVLLVLALWEVRAHWLQYLLPECPHQEILRGVPCGPFMQFT